MSTEEQLDNTNSIANIIETGEEHEVMMILGDREKVRHTGIIRAGVKVPKANCTAAEKEKFLKLEADGLSYDEIDRQIGGEPKTSKSKLRPSNVDYFVVRDCDFKRPADAEYIRQHYADSDGRVRRIPIWLTSGDIYKAAPHNFRAFDGSGNVRAVSGYGADHKPICRYVPAEIKHPKKDDWQERPCDPDNCKAYGGKKCAFGGLYRVNVCGLRGIGEVVVPTRSWYGLSDAVAVLKKVRSVLGRFDGLLNGQPFLELVKVPETVKDPDGKKVTQWIITIELSVDPMELARHAEKLHDRGARALSILNGQPPAPKMPDIPSETVPVAEPAAAPEPDQPEPKAEISERRQKCYDFLKKTAQTLGLEEQQLNEFAATQNFGMDINDLNDDEIANFCNSLKSTLKNKPAEDVKADILAVVGG